jgi:hypothetical protein
LIDRFKRFIARLGMERSANPKKGQHHRIPSELHHRVCDVMIRMKSDKSVEFTMQNVSRQ